MRFFRKRAKKLQNIGKFGQKCTKFENILKKGSLMHATISKQASKQVSICNRNKTMKEKNIHVYLIQKYIKDILKCPFLHQLCPIIESGLAQS